VNINVFLFIFLKYLSKEHHKVSKIIDIWTTFWSYVLTPIQEKKHNQRGCLSHFTLKQNIWKSWQLL